MRIVLIGMLFIVYMLAKCPDWLAWTYVPYMVRASAYSFFHANLFHLAINCLSIWVVFDPRKKDNTIALIVGALIAVLVYPLALKPVVGFSNVLYAIIGFRSPSFKSSWWKHPSVLLFLAITVAMVFIPHFSATTHMGAFALGVAFAHIRRLLNQHNLNVRKLTTR